jgi:branched-chain amino acid transport system ATP-binding protein
MARLSLEAVTRSFGGLKAVDGVSLTVEPGRITGLIGPNGAGKTTVVNLITGILSLSAGRILFDGQDISRLEPHQVARAGIARTFQNIRLLPEQTVLENIMVGAYREESAGLLASLIGLPSVGRDRARIEAKARSLIADFAMQRFINYPAGGLSYGHQRRVEIIRALAASPRLLLLDEPVAGMNDVEAEQLGVIFRRLADDGMAILLVEHNMKFVMSLCAQLYVLVSGARIADGTAAEIGGNPRVIDAYLGA